MNVFKFSILSLCLVSSSISYAQLEKVKAPTIELSGHAEKEVTPDEIYITVHIVERYDGKEKSTLEAQEAALISALKAKGLDIDKMKLTNGYASYVRIPWRSKKDVLASANYEIMVGTAEEAAKIFEATDELDLSSCRIGRLDHSKREQFEQEVRIAAMKDAATKADYMLNAIDSKRGKTLLVRETGSNQQPVYNQQYGSRAYDLEMSSIDKVGSSFQVSFKKMAFESNVYVEFEIE
jgi:uncharacterized protein